MTSTGEDTALFEGRDTDIVIPVMGPTKSGKSSFLNLLLEGLESKGQSTFIVETKLASCTKVVSAQILPHAPREYAALNQALGDRRIVLVDTPGFDDTYKNDEDILRCISDWMTASYRKRMLVGGVLYLHDISRDGFPESSLKNLNLFVKLCGDDAMNQVTFVTTKWDRLKYVGEGEDRVTELRGQFWSRMIGLGAMVSHVQPPNLEQRLSRQHRKPWEIAHNVVLSAKAREIRQRILQIQDEVVNRKRFLAETDAGRELRRSLERMLETAKDLRKQEKEDAKGGRKDAVGLLQERQSEIDELTRQLKAMELPGLHTRAKRWLVLKCRKD